MENIILLFSSPDTKIWVNELLYAIAKHQCLVEESRFMYLGAEWGGMIRLSGGWNAIAKMEDVLTTLKTDNPTLWLEFKRSTLLKLEGEYLPYLVQAVGANKPTFLNELTHFFIEQQIPLLDVQTDSFRTTHSDTQLVTLSMRIYIPTHLSIADLRERFMLLCEELNADGILEPEKTIK